MLKYIRVQVMEYHIVIKNDDVALIHLYDKIPGCTKWKTESSSQNRVKDTHRKRENREELYQNVSIHTMLTTFIIEQ